MIRGRYHPNARWPVPLVRVWIRAEDISPEWVPVECLVDTGAAVTSVHPRDATARLKIDPKRLASTDSWPAGNRLGGISGSATYFPVPAAFGFLHDDGAFQILTGTLHVAMATRSNRTIPSLLGWDLLRHFEVLINHAAGLVTLASV